MGATIAGFERRRCRDSLGRRIEYFVSPAVQHPAPLLVHVQGSGCHSVFSAGDDGRIRPRHQGVLAAVAGGRASVLAVEKPGVRFLDDPGPRGTADRCRPAFVREHTLDRWVEAVAAAIRAEAEPGVPTAVIGHSEGGIVAACLARRLPVVTHVALLGSSGPTQLFDLLSDPARSPTDIADALRAIDTRPDAARAFVWGHPHRRWSSFLATSALDELVQTRSRVLIVHGTRDQVVPVAAARVLYVELLRRGRDVELVELDAGHDLRRPRQSRRRALESVFTRIVDWVSEVP